MSPKHFWKPKPASDSNIVKSALIVVATNRTAAPKPGFGTLSRSSLCGFTCTPVATRNANSQRAQETAEPVQFSPPEAVD
jgi:hypothetical protein